MSSPLGAASVGIGLRQPHYRELLGTLPEIDFLEVHSENFFADGGAALQVLERARAHYPVSVHGVGLSLGSADPLSTTHLDKLARLVERVEPALVSEHLCFGAVGTLHFNDLLPFPYTDEALDLLVTRVGQVQDRLRRAILVENLSSYVNFRASRYSETGFLAELARRSGCKVLLDVNNLYVNSVNFGFDPLTQLDELSGESIGEVHLAGHLVTDECLIDDHGSRVADAVWSLYRATIERFGARPTLIEWDTDVPALDVLLAEAKSARSHRAAAETLYA